jgi:hypothetical protein
MITSKSKQYGFILYGGGINPQVWINAARTEGYKIVLRAGYAEFWK